MSPEASAAAALRRLLADLAADREALARLAAESGATVAAAGLVRRSYHRPLLAERPGSHRELLDAMLRPLEGIRPPVIAAELASDLRELLALRHFFRHAYAVDLDPQEILAHSARLARLHPLVGRDLDAFVGFLRAALDALV